MYIMIKLGKSATKAIAASKSPSAKLTVHCSIKMTLNYSAMFTMDHTLMDFLRFNEKPHQRKRISSLPVSGAFVGCFIVVFFRGWPFTERTTPNIIAKSLVYYCNFPVGLPPQEKAPTSLPPIAFFLGFCLLCLWVVGAFFGGANPTGKLLVYNLWGVRLVGCCPCMFIIPARARGSRP